MKHERVKLPEGMARTKQINFRLSESELEELFVKAQEAGAISVTQFIRMKLFPEKYEGLDESEV